MDTIKKGSLLTLQRYKISAVAFVGFVFLYALRTDFSVALVCMVKTPNQNTSSSYIKLNVSGSWEAKPGCEEGVSSTRLHGQGGEFLWDKQLQSKMLASFFYGYITTQIFGGWLARRYGGRRVIGYGMACCILTTFLMPVCARAHVALVFVLRVLAGVSTGVVFPTMHCIWGRWAPPLERTKLTAIHASGPAIGNILTFLISGYLCAYGFDNGWGSIFYLFGVAACLWLAAWFYTVYDTPEVHPRISASEREYIETSIGDRYLEDEKKIKTPWAAMLKSPALWAIISAQFCNNWTGYSLLTGLPMYMKEVLNYDIKQNGALTAIPYLCQFVTGVLTGFVADTLRERKCLTTANTRRLIQCTSLVGMAVFMVATGYVTCENRVLAVVFLSLANSFSYLGRSGYLVNHIDIGPRYAGEQLGITNTAGTVPGMIAPLVNGALTPNKTQEEWQKVFFLCGGLAIFGAICFGVLVRGEVQPWAMIPSIDVTEKPDCGKDRKDQDLCVHKNGYELIVQPPRLETYTDVDNS